MRRFLNTQQRHFFKRDLDKAGQQLSTISKREQKQLEVQRTSDALMKRDRANTPIFTEEKYYGR